MQYPGDADLAAAVANPERVIDVLLELDWDRDGLYGHAYSDMSWLVTSAVVDASTIADDAPDELKTIVGAASSELRVVLGGSRFAGDIPADVASLLDSEWNEALATTGISATQLFNPYLADSPLHGYRTPGTPVRYSRIETTASGDVAVRQFTGWVRDITLDVETREVHLIASDVADITRRTVTLPMWAAYPPGYWDESGPEGAYSPGHEIAATWVYEEILRQGGRPTGPATRDDANLYLSCNGSFLPSVGSFVNARNDSQPPPHAVSYGATSSPWVWPWKQGQYGLAPVFIADMPEDPQLRNEAYLDTATTIVPPTDGSSDPPVDVGMSMWVEVDDRPSAARNLELAVAFDDGSPDFNGVGSIDLEVSNDGERYLVVSNFLPGGGGKFWSWDFPTLTPGWHYIAFVIRFDPTSVTLLSAHVDDSSVTPSSSSSSTGGIVENTPIPDGETNQVVFRAPIPCQHVQIWSGQNATYTVGQGEPPTTPDGLPWAVVRDSYMEMQWLPDVHDRQAWELLKEIATAEFGAVWTNEHGQIEFANHATIRQATTAAVAAATPVDDTTLLSTLINPTDDHYANEISISHQNRTASEQVVWRNDGPLDYYAKAGESRNSVVDLVDTVSVITFLDTVSATPPTDGEPITKTACSAVRGDNVSIEHPGGWAYNIHPLPTQRQLQLLWQGGATVPAYVGSYLGGNIGSWTVAGWRYSEPTITRRTYRDDTEIAAHGRHVLSIPDSPWRQTLSTADALATDLLYDTVNPTPVIDGISIPADPRLQLLDVIELQVDGEWTGSIFGTVIGIHRSDGPDGAIDTITVRVARTPGIALWDETSLGWDVGTWGQ